MSLTVGELFVNLGIKGGEKTVGALTSIKKGLGETASMSLEAKAAIVGAIYALERLFAASGAMGTNLTNFNALTGLSTKQLQEWQYAARQAGVSNEEFTGSLKAVQGAMTNMLLGKGAPEGMALLANKVGFDPKRARDTFYVMEQLQKFAKTVPADVGNSVLKSFGISEGTIAAMRRGSFNTGAFAKAPTYSEKEIGALNRANIAWSNLGTKIEMAVGHFNAKHGGELVQDLSKITTQVIKLVEALTSLAEKLQVFKAIEKTFEFLGGIFGAVNKQVGAIKNPSSYKSTKEPGKTGYGQMWKDAFSKDGIKSDLNGLMDFLGLSNSTLSPQSATPKMPHQAGKNEAKQTVNINQHLNFQHDGKDHKRTGDSVKKANQDALRQFNNGQVS